MGLKVIFKDNTSTIFEDVEYYAVDKYSVEIVHLNKTRRLIAKIFIKDMGEL